MVLTKYKAVFFDVGGTLIQAHPSVGDIYAQHARPYGFCGSPDDLNRQFSQEWKKIGGMESLLVKGGPEAETRFWHNLVLNVFAPFGGIRDFDNYFDVVYHAFTLKNNWLIYNDVVESDILEKLKRKGIILGVVSNWDSRLQQTLSNLGLAHYFDFILASTVVGSAKPDEKIFHEALRQSKVDASEACHIGDEPYADYQGASKLGMGSILVDRLNQHRDTKISPKIRSFLELT